jgi:hypothetical protein
MILCIFLLYEWQKGEDSFWKCYIDVLPDAQFIYDWDIQSIVETQHRSLIVHASDMRHQSFDEWDFIGSFLTKYVPSIFKAETITKENYNRMFNRVCTRCHGWGLPSTLMAPFADMFNHSNAQNFWEIINEQKHMDGRVRSEYHSKTKFMNDYSDLFTKLPSYAEKLNDASADEK